MSKTLEEKYEALLTLYKNLTEDYFAQKKILDRCGQLLPVPNGWILDVGESTFVFQDSEEHEIENFGDFLCEIRDSCGFAGSRYDAKRITITIEPGDKYQDEPPSNE